MRLDDLLTALALARESPRACWAAFAWPKFSVTSYRVVSRLVAQGIMPRTVIDVGANAGQFAVAAARLFPAACVHAFEPVPATVQRLRHNVAHLGNVTVHPVALGERPAEADMHVNVHTHASSFLALAAGHREAFPDAREIGTVRVTVSTLDEALAGVEMVAPVLLKLDVQGYETAVLRGGTATLRRTDIVLAETSFRQLYEGEPLFTDLLDLLRERGFRFERPVDWARAPRTGEILQMDALFFRRPQG